MGRHSLAIFDLDGTLFDSQQSIVGCILLTFEQLAPTQDPIYS